MLLRRIERSIRARGLVAAGDRGLVAFSGGPDSLCLLHLLATLRKSWRLDLIALHVDHGLRPGSAADAEQALRLAASLDVPALIRRARIGAGPGRNLQEAARLARREILEEEARQRGAAWVALGHTALDQAETVLMRLLRGAGPAGLAGMRWRAGLYIRPLLDVTRGEVERHLAAEGLTAIEDPSNRTARFLRNRVRRELLPLLERENPAVISALCRLAETCGEEDEALELLAAEKLERARRGRGELALDELDDLPRGLLHRVLRRAYAEVTGSSRRLERKHLLAMARLAGATEGSASLNVPGLRAERRYRLLRLVGTAGAGPEVAPLGELRLDGPGRLQLGDGRVLELVPAGEQSGDSGRLVARLNAERLSFPLSIRGTRPGDRIRVGTNRSRKVARLLMDAKIPRQERSRVPLLLAGSEVMVVVGVRCAHGLEARPGAPELLLRWYERGGGAC